MSFQNKRLEEYEKGKHVGFKNADTKKKKKKKKSASWKRNKKKHPSRPRTCQPRMLILENHAHLCSWNLALHSYISSIISNTQLLGLCPRLFTWVLRACRVRSILVRAASTHISTLPHNTMSSNTTCWEMNIYGRCVPTIL